MLLIRPELLLHEYDLLSTQPCIEPGPIRWSQERRKTSRGHEKIRPPCRNTLYCYPSPKWNPPLCLNSVSMVKRSHYGWKKKKKVVTYFNQMVGVSWGVCGRSYVSASSGQCYFRIRRQIFLVSIERNQKQSVDAKWTEGGFKENPMKLVSLQRVPT